MPREIEPPEGDPSNSDDEATDLSLASLSPHALSSVPPLAVLPFDPSHPRAKPPPPPPEDVPIEPPPEESPWRFNALAAVLLTALICALTVSLALLVRLAHTRAILASVEEDAEDESVAAAAAAGPGTGRAAPHRIVRASSSSAANGNAPGRAGASVEIANAQANGATSAGDSRAANSGAGDTADSAPSGPPGAFALSSEPANSGGREQLVLLLTIGSEKFAKKQLLLLREHCNAPLEVYRQTRGRCAWDDCFVVATPAANADEARACGHGSGHILRDRDDFELP